MPSSLGAICRVALGVATLMLPVVPCAGDDKSAIDGIVEPFRKDKGYVGLVIGITRPSGRQVLGYGTVTLEGGTQAPDRNTLFEIGSITKVFTGTLLADQVRQGTVRLDDPVQKHLPAEWKVPRRDDRDITLLHLATHTSSLPVQPPLIGVFALLTKDPADPYAQYRPPQLQKTLAGLSLQRPIGSQFEYSNLGVGLLGHALAHAAKAKSYEELLVQRVLGPLGMSDTRIELSASQCKRLAPGHTTAGKLTSGWTFGCLEGCGGLRSSVRDLLAFTEANLGRSKTPLAGAIQLAHEPWRETSRKGEFVGLCWMRQKRPSDRWLLWHNGGTGGYRSFLGFLPDKGAGVVILSNSAHSVDALGIEILKHVDSSTGKDKQH